MERLSGTKVLITGAAGFIGYHVTQRLIAENASVTALDNLNDYYDVTLKQDRLDQLSNAGRLDFHKVDIADAAALRAVFDVARPDVVIHLAAQAGVRYSLENPGAYIDSNLVGFGNILECCRHGQVKHLVFASSSSVYGANSRLPYSVEDGVDHPVSLYAATKKANEVMAHAYSSLYQLPATGLRFFTVYGPWGRPDMAYFKFTKAIVEGKPIKVFNNGDMQRDFTYVDDIVEAVIRLVPELPTATDQPELPLHPGVSFAPYRLFNIGNHAPVRLMDFISILEEVTGREAIKEFEPMQAGDVLATFADVRSLMEVVDFRPDTSLKEGLQKFYAWYRKYYSGI